jgi:hypothetical protein
MTIGKDTRELTAEELDVVTGGIFQQINNIAHALATAMEHIDDNSTKDLRDMVRGAPPK